MGIYSCLTQVIFRGHPLDMFQMFRNLTPDKLFGKASDRRDGSAIEHTLNWSLHSLAGLCSQQQFLRKLKSPVFGFNMNMFLLRPMPLRARNMTKVSYKVQKFSKSQPKHRDACSWKGQLERTRSWKVLSWKV